jgi:glycosyltransferase involved in cell wall biosynthesis
MRLAVYCDYSYQVRDGRLFAELPFALFLQRLGEHFDRLVLVGRLDHATVRFPFELHGAELVPLPHYASGAQLTHVLGTMPRSCRRFWRALDGVDAVWLLGPNPPHVLLFALIALARRRRLVLGVRQDLPRLMRHRHPSRRSLHALASVLELCFRALGRVVPVVVVGADLAERYRGSKRLHQTLVSLLSAGDVSARANGRPGYGDARELRMLSVGRLDPEKNPLLLADVLAAAVRLDPRWRLDVCGEGTLRSALTARMSALGLADRVTFHGYVPIDGGLWELYRGSHALIHVSRTEGVPQVLLEAFAARLPVVATEVGGVPSLLRDRGLLVPVDDADAAARSLQRLVDDPGLRGALVERAAEAASAHTIEAECASLAAFVRG